MCKFDDDPLCLDELLRDDLVAHIPSLKQIDQNCRDGCWEVWFGKCFVLSGVWMVMKSRSGKVDHKVDRKIILK